ncbi:unnamed protein product [Eruca vesicaria subsp. sativa]|uniref:Uncharacterized protein n=1 Tax=Eruca vesicaria subsp. sativa TaxID=29727 RepID=A0ABC8KCJ0_ERUVS|nr:unnamed protein product [Eruca vesicaria subsp. sativa]
MRNLKISAGMRPVKKEPMVIDLDSDDEDTLCGEMNDCMIDTGESNTSNMQMIFSADDGGDDWGNKIDQQYLKLFDSLMNDGNSYLSDNPLRCFRYEVDNGGYDTREFKHKQESREDQNTSSGRATKKNIVESRPSHHVQASSKKRKNVVESRPSHHVQASSRKRREFVSRRRDSPVNDKSVDATSHARRSSQHNVCEAREKEIVEAEMVPDENYRSHLRSLVEKRKRSSTNPGKKIQVKREEDAMSLSDSDSIEVNDRPFLDEEDSPFVPSKSYKVVDLEEESDDDEGDECNSWFRKEIMNVLKQPYNEKEFKELEHEASVCRYLTKSTELLDGRDITYTTKEKRPSYLDQYPEFKRMFEKALDGEEHHSALNLLRGFIFYLTKVARHDAFKPWLDHECLNITCF